MAFCRYCHKEIDFIRSLSGKNVPVEGDYINYNDAPQGTILVTTTGVIYTVNKAKNLPSVKGRVSHFSVCEGSEDWRAKA